MRHGIKDHSQLKSEAKKANVRSQCWCKIVGKVEGKGSDKVRGSEGRYMRREGGKERGVREIVWLVVKLSKGKARVEETRIIH